MIFQERVDKALELRVTAVGRRLFAASVDSQSAVGAQVDWRHDCASIDSTWKRFALPREIGQRLIALLEHFELMYAAFDLILKPDGGYVFLELNSFGDFAGQENGLRFPISDAIADLLLKGKRRA
jgi:hypothetical protein